MATTGHFSGTKIFVLVNGELVGCQKDSDLDISFDQIDATCKDNDGAKKTLPGQVSWSINMDAVQVYNDANGFQSLVAASLNKNSVAVMWSTGAEGDPVYSGNAYITKLNAKAPLNDVATYSVTFSGDGPLSSAIVGAGGLFN
jgi:predicted secreted protein